MWFTSSSGRIQFQITKAQANQGFHTGECEADIQDLRTVPNIKRYLAKIDPEMLKEELRQYGAWEADQLEKHEDNLDRILWLACGDIAEGMR